MEIRRDLYRSVVSHVNRKSWWHVPPIDPDAYRKRGKFLASTYSEAEFWGRPLDGPQKVTVVAPLIGDETTVERRLFGKQVSTKEITVRERFRLDASMKRIAITLGYDSILLMAPQAFTKLKNTGAIPRSLELNILQVG